MILEKTKFSISKQLVNPQWQLKIAKKIQQKFFAFLNAYYPKIHLIKAPNSLDSSLPNGSLSKNLKRRLWGIIPAKNDFESCSAVNFSKKNMQILETWKLTEDMKFKTDFFSHALLYVNSL